MSYGTRDQVQLGPSSSYGTLRRPLGMDMVGDGGLVCAIAECHRTRTDSAATRAAAESRCDSPAEPVSSRHPCTDFVARSSGESGSNAESHLVPAGSCARALGSSCEIRRPEQAESCRSSRWGNAVAATHTGADTTISAACLLSKWPAQHRRAQFNAVAGTTSGAGTNRCCCRDTRQRLWRTCGGTTWAGTTA